MTSGGTFKNNMTKKKPRKPGQKPTREMTKISVRIYADQQPISASEIREAIDFWRRRDKKQDTLFFH